MNRRHSLHTRSATPLIAAERSGRAPFRQAREPFRKELPERMEGLVDAPFRQPGPRDGAEVAEPGAAAGGHGAWILERYGTGPDTWRGHVHGGGDVAKVFLALNKPAKFDLDFAAPSGGWEREARIRILAGRILAGTEWGAAFHGEPVKATNDVSEPFEACYPSMRSKHEELRARRIPAQRLREGRASFEVTLWEREPSTVLFHEAATRWNREGITERTLAAHPGPGHLRTASRT